MVLAARPPLTRFMTASGDVGVRIAFLPLPRHVFYRHDHEVAQQTRTNDDDVDVDALRYSRFLSFYFVSIFFCIAFDRLSSSIDFLFLLSFRFVSTFIVSYHLVSFYFSFRSVSYRLRSSPITSQHLVPFHLASYQLLSSPIVSSFHLASFLPVVRNK